ncbi:MAG: response regulator transcription factor [Propionibacteriaceae bacterium]|jgi:DNA-binding NarL/FixJ family response regulator|nr:response regulator transcription factor [Propionibacteriaceae bacterium]
MIKIAIVDDQPLVRTGMAMVVNSQEDMHVDWQASSGSEAVREVAARPVDLILMDVRMQEMDGIAATAQLIADADAAGKTAPKVIMLTTYDLDEYLLAAIQAGASGFLLKNVEPEELLRAIRTVMDGDAVLAPSSTKRMLEHVAASGQLVFEEDPRIASLTEREREVLELMAKGLNNAEIAEQLYLGETTVKTHVRRVLAKLDARDRVQAVVVAFKSGIA